MQALIDAFHKQKPLPAFPESTYYFLMTEGMEAVWEELARWKNMIGVERLLSITADNLFRHIVVHVAVKQAKENNDYAFLQRILSVFYKTNPNYLPQIVAKTADGRDLDAKTVDELYIRSNISTAIKDISAQESIVTAVSPIVPYVGVLRKPGTTAASATLKDIKDSDLEKQFIAAGLESEMGNETITVDFIIQMMKKIVWNHAYLEMLLDKETRIALANIRGIDGLADVQMSLSSDSTVPLPVRVFMALAFIVGNFQELSKDEMIDLLTLIYPFAQNFSGVMESMMRVTNQEAAEADLTHIIRNELSSDEIVQKENYQDGSKANPLDYFDIDALTNYIYTARRFRTNTYTNSAMLDIPKSFTYTFYNGFAIIQPESLEGESFNFIYVPVIDDLNNSQVMIVRMWRNGKIDLLTEAEFRVEMGDKYQDT